MKKKLIGFTAIVMTLLISCNNTETKTEDKDTVVVQEKVKEITTVYKTVEVAPIVQTKFIEKYPAATEIQWVNNRDVPETAIDWDLSGWAPLDTMNYAANYKVDSTSFWSWFTSQGDWIYTVSTIYSSEVPDAVNKTLQSQFPTYTITSVQKENDKNRTAYQIKMENGEDKMTALIDEKGNIMKKKGKVDGQKIKEKNF